MHTPLLLICATSMWWYSLAHILFVVNYALSVGLTKRLQKNQRTLCNELWIVSNFPPLSHCARRGRTNGNCPTGKPSKRGFDILPWSDSFSFRKLLLKYLLYFHQCNFSYPDVRTMFKRFSPFSLGKCKKLLTTRERTIRTKSFYFGIFALLMSFVTSFE